MFYHLLRKAINEFFHAMDKSINFLTAQKAFEVMKLRNRQKALDMLKTKNLWARGFEMAKSELASTGHLRVAYLNE